MTRDEIISNPNANSLIQCAMVGNTSLVQLALALGVDVDESNSGRTALTEAASFNHVETVAFLLDHGADIDKPGMGGNTALSMAVIDGNEYLISMLLERGADVAAANMIMKTPLAFAASPATPRQSPCCWNTRPRSMQRATKAARR